MAFITGRVTRRAALAAVAGAAMLRPASKGLRLGGPIFLKSDDPAQLAAEHRRLGYSAACVPTIATLARAKEIEQAYAKENVIVAEVGAWVNMLDPDAEKRKKNLEYVTERMALADAVGARCCVDISGSYDPKTWYGPHPDNMSQRAFDATIENCRRVLDAVKPTRSKLAIEMMGWCIPDGPDSYLKLLKAMDRKAFGVHVDACNVINSPDRFWHNGDVTRELFRKLGPHIVSCHAKDLAWVVELQVRFQEVIPGRGKVDYNAYLSELAKLNDVPLMLEHLRTAEEYAEAAGYVRKVAGGLGLQFV